MERLDCVPGLMLLHPRGLLLPETYVTLDFFMLVGAFDPRQIGVSP